MTREVRLDGEKIGRMGFWTPLTHENRAIRKVEAENLSTDGAIWVTSPGKPSYLGYIGPYIRKILSPEEILSVGPPKTGGCWEWQGAFDAKGYGRIVVDRKEVRAHRFSYELANGPIPSGLHVLWRCGNSRCVRPDHLYLGRAPVKRTRREASVNAKLTEAQVEEIRSRAADGETMAELARNYGVGKTTIWRVVKRESWADI